MEKKKEKKLYKLKVINQDDAEYESVLEMVVFAESADAARKLAANKDPDEARKWTTPSETSCSVARKVGVVSVHYKV